MNKIKVIKQSNKLNDLNNIMITFLKYSCHCRSSSKYLSGDSLNPIKTNL